MKKLLVISGSISVAHLFEDISLFIIGRYTEIHWIFVFIGIISLGLILGLLARHPKIKKYIGE